MTDSLKRVVLGRAQRSDKMGEATLSKKLALPIFASDAVSSNAYSTQEILIVLALGGATLYSFAPWITALVVLVFFVVVASYRQNVHAYPSGGGDYEVVATNLGQKAGVFVACALLVDYVLTVAVSVASGVANLASAVPLIGDHSTVISVIVIILIMVVNLRGVRESGGVFAIPVYGFMLGVYGMLAFALVKTFTGQVMLAESAGWTINPEATFTGLGLVFLLARAFSSGTTALTGIEAISNGVPAFKAPKSKNAATTLALLGIVATTMMATITWLAIKTQVHITDNNADMIGLPAGQTQKTVIAQVSDAVFGDFHLVFFYLTVTTALILALAANTAFNGFPVLGSVLARDGYLPRQLHTRGDRLAFSNGIIVLAAMAIILVILYQANVSGLIQLYIVGVFVSFTLSQLGMMRHWTRFLTTETDPKERRRMIRSRIINAVGFAFTGAVLIIVLVTKFTKGAWIVCLAMPLLYLLMLGIRRHYDRVAVELTPDVDEKVMLPSRVHALVLASKLHKPTLRALAYARASRPTVLEAVTVNVDSESTESLIAEWDAREIPVTLKVLDSPYREITRPILDYVRSIRRESPRDLVTVYVPEYVVGHWWEHLLHNQSALRLKTRLLFTPGVMVTSVPWQLESSERLENKPVSQGPGALRRGEPSSVVADAVVRDEYGLGPMRHTDDSSTP
jgi:hypothetical protein